MQERKNFSLQPWGPRSAGTRLPARDFCVLCHNLGTTPLQTVPKAGGNLNSPRHHCEPQRKEPEVEPGHGAGQVLHVLPAPSLPFLLTLSNFFWPSCCWNSSLVPSRYLPPHLKETSNRCHFCLCWQFTLCFCSFSGIAPLQVRRGGGGNNSRNKSKPACVAGCWRGFASLQGGDCPLRQPRRGQRGLLRGTFRQAEKSHGVCLCARG